MFYNFRHRPNRLGLAKNNRELSKIGHIAQRIVADLFL